MKRKQEETQTIRPDRTDGAKAGHATRMRDRLDSQLDRSEAQDTENLNTR